MRRFTAFCFALSLLAGTYAQAEDGLFSDSPITPVFSRSGAVGQPNQQPVGPPQGQPGQENGGSASLAESLKLAGFEPNPVSEQVVQTKVQVDKWSFPVLVTNNQQKQEVVVVVLLTLVKDEKQLAAGKLLELLDASREHAPAYFAYSSKRKRIELYRTVEGRSPSAEMLKKEIYRLAEIAKNTEQLWNLSAVQVNKPVTAVASAPQKAAPAPSLAGKWSASKSAKEAFALQLSADGKYTLVHVAQGKQTKSTGNFTLAGQQLTLAATDGTKVAGTITSQTAKEFVFAPSGKSSPLTFKRAS